MVSKASAIGAALERRGEWGEAITDVEVNAWLAQDLPRVAPSLVAGGMGTPTVRFLPRSVAVSAPVGAGPFSGRAWAVVTLAVPRDNEILVEVESAGVGLVPLPAGPIVTAITARATAAGLAAETRSNGRPGVRITLPGRVAGGRRADLEYHLEGVRIDDGEIVVAGSTRPPTDR